MFSAGTARIFGSSPNSARDHAQSAKSLIQPREPACQIKAVWRLRIMSTEIIPPETSAHVTMFDIRPARPARKIRRFKALRRENLGVYSPDA
ncbi:MAG: hypothetical protein ACXU8Q_15360 [Caulobacteraceae bacterium]